MRPRLVNFRTAFRGSPQRLRDSPDLTRCCNPEALFRSRAFPATHCRPTGPWCGPSRFTGLGRESIGGAADGRAGGRRDRFVRRRCGHAHGHADFRPRDHQLAGFFPRGRSVREIRPARCHQCHTQPRRLRPALIARRDASGQRPHFSDQPQRHPRRRRRAHRYRRFSRFDARCGEQ